ncbi:hypothetical protein HDV02_005513 [Globomyces sp. JEL0801]|nr:hypothetical protein HDV02_005513 [Globomyces sp. JEL0801]
MFGLGLLINFLLLLDTVTAVSKPCSSISRRIEWREMSDAAKNRFLDAILCLRSTPSLQYPSDGNDNRWNDFVRLHYIDSQAPDLSPIWDWFGGNGKVSTGCISAGIKSSKLQDITAIFPQPHCVKRAWSKYSDGGTPLGSYYSPATIQYILNSVGYRNFRVNLESYAHNVVHQAIGGDMADPSQSVNDPIFFMHHANVDRIWWQWQQKSSGNLVAYYGSTTTQYSFGVIDSRRFTIAEMMNTQKNELLSLCHTYSNSVAPQSPSGVLSKRALYERKLSLLAKRDAVEEVPTFTVQEIKKLPDAIIELYNMTTPDNGDRDSLNGLRHPNPLKVSHLLKWGYTKSQIKKILEGQEKINNFIDFINTLPIPNVGSMGTLIAGEESGWRPVSEVEATGDQNLHSALVIAGTSSEGMLKLNF